ncbi:hypothetical protein KY285_024067 [Solanum tuberosum]|nr:hypothetical protein KY285_024067 [Solanum tuberosum]
MRPLRDQVCHVTSRVYPRSRQTLRLTMAFMAHQRFHGPLWPLRSLTSGKARDPFLMGHLMTPTTARQPHHEPSRPSWEGRWPWKFWQAFTSLITGCGPLHGPSRDPWRVPWPSFGLLTCLLGLFSILLDSEVLQLAR